MSLKIIPAVLLLVACALTSAAQVPNDVPKGHWAYDAVNELVEHGYVSGFPNGMFLGDRTLTRYEFAVIIAHILEGLNEKFAAIKSQGSSSDPAREVNPQDLATISKLIDEFSVELVVIGARLDTVEAAIKLLKQTLSEHEAKLKEQESKTKSNEAAVSKLEKIRIGGYIQTRYQTLDYTNDLVDPNLNYDTFFVRRARLRLIANPTLKSTAVLQLDMGKNDPSVKDAYLNYAFGDCSAVSPSFQIGQQHWWFGYEVPYSSANRETPERALFARRFFPGERDTGAVITGPANSKICWTLGAYNGTGTVNGQTSSVDNNNAKDVLANVKFNFNNLHFGMSGYNGYGIWYYNAAGLVLYDPTKKIRYGADLQYCLSGFTFKGEYIRGKGFDGVRPGPIQDTYQDGFYAQLDYNIDRNTMFVTRYSTMSTDPALPQYGRISSWELGVIRRLDCSTRLKLFYKLTNEEYNEIDGNNGFVAEWITIY